MAHLPLPDNESTHRTQINAIFTWCEENCVGEWFLDDFCDYITLIDEQDVINYTLRWL